MNENDIWKMVDRVAKQSECSKRQVGCVIYHTEFKQVCGRGFNIHLDNICDCSTNKSAQHAEITAINSVLRPLDRSKMIAYVNHKPCDNCNKALSEVVQEVRYTFQ